jgi:hypothetical protein
MIKCPVGSVHVSFAWFRICRQPFLLNSKLSKILSSLKQLLRALHAFGSETSLTLYIQEVFQYMFWQFPIEARQKRSGLFYLQVPTREANSMFA